MRALHERPPPPPPALRATCRFRQSRRAAHHRHPPVALYLAGGPGRPEAAGARRHGTAAGRQARDHCGALHLQMGDRRARRPWQRAGRGVELAGLGAGRTCRHDHRLWRHAHPDGGAHATARWVVRQGGDACRAPACLSHLRTHARAVAALSSRAQDRGADARIGARPQRHRNHCAHGDPAALAHHHRADAHRRCADVEVRLALRASNHDYRRRLHDLYLSRDRMAHRHPPPHERERH